MAKKGKSKKKSKSANVSDLPKRRYDGARLNRSNSDWLVSSSSADSDLRSDLVRLRNRSRDLIRNNPYLKHAIQAFQSLIGFKINWNLNLASVGL